MLKKLEKDYFPLSLNNKWYYLIDRDTIKVEVISEEEILGKNAKVIEIGFDKYYICEEDKEIYFLLWDRCNINGDYYDIVKSWIKLCPLPLCDGAVWSDSVKGITTLLGDTISYDYKLKGRCDFVGKFYQYSNCYKLTIILNDDSSFVWLSPNIGAVKFIIEKDTFSLLKYEF